MKNNVLTKYLDNSLTTPFDKVFKNFFDSDYSTPFYRSSIGSVNIIENEKDYVLEVSVPGYEKENIKIDIEDGAILIKGEIKKENQEVRKNYSRREFGSSSFIRSFVLPDDIKDDISAKMDNGILTIVLNKKEPEPKKESKVINIE